MSFTLTIATGPDTGTAFPFTEKQARFGRTADNDVVVKDGSASRSHCRVYEEGGKYFLEDLKSANGTKVNGNVVEASMPLALYSGDTITIGDVSFTFSLPDATMMQASTLDAPPLDANATMIGAPPPDLMLPHHDGASTAPEAAPIDPNATFLKSPDELEAIKASWKERGGAPAAPPAKRPPTRPPPKVAEESPSGEVPQPEGGATMLKSPEELEAIKAQWKDKMGPTGEAPAAKRPATRPPPAKAQETDSGEQVPQPEGGATMLKSPEELESLRAQWKKDLEGQDSGPSTNPTMEGGGATNPEMQALPPLSDATVPPRSGLAKRGGDKLDANETREIPPGAAGKRPSTLSKKKDKEEAEAGSAMTAAEKARQKRELGGSAGGRLQLLWAELPKNKKIVVGAGGGVVGLGFLGMLIFALMPPPKAPTKILPPEPETISANAPTIEQSFGAGDDIDYSKPDLKQFTFNTNAPTRVVVLLHYQAKDISKDEVAVTLNGADVGSVPPDNMDVMGRENELVFPTNVIKPREDNVLVFDNVRNPPGKEPWRIWNLWLEVLPMPELSKEDAITEARAAVARAKKAYDLREVGPENLFKAWKQYRQAWLLLEGLSDRPEDLYTSVRQQLKMTVPEMDKVCANLLLEIKKEQESPNADYKRIKEMVEGIQRYFPTREHRCFNISKGLMTEMSGN